MWNVAIAMKLLEQMQPLVVPILELSWNSRGNGPVVFLIIFKCLADLAEHTHKI